MHARVTRVRGGEGDMDQAIDTIRRQIVPKARELEGLVAGYWLINRQSGEGLTVTFWDSEQALAASEDAAAKLRRDAALADEDVAVERYEVVAQI